MGPRVVRDFMTFGDHPFDDRGILGNTLADHEKGRMDFTLLEHVEQPRRVRPVRAVVEGDGDMRAIDVALGDGDFRCSGGGWGRDIGGDRQDGRGCLRLGRGRDRSRRGWRGRGTDERRRETEEYEGQEADHGGNY